MLSEGFFVFGKRFADLFVYLTGLCVERRSLFFKFILGNYER